MLHIYHSNSLYQLSNELLQQMSDHSLPALQSETILVQNPGMKRWLQQRISQQSGIAANIEFPLPSRFIWDIFMSQFDDVQSLSAFDGEVLRWFLLDVLREHADDAELSLLKPWLESDQQGLAAFQLAEKLAALFDQYLVYRPAMVARWEQGQTSQRMNEDWQAYLWRLLIERNRQPHRAELIRRLIERLQSGRAEINRLPQRVFVFAISAMSPQYLNVLAALGQHVEIHLFNHNPCAHYWGDIESRKEQLRRGDTPFEINELLASLGKQGRDYIDQIYGLGFDYREYDAFVDIQGSSLLASIQRDILHLTASADNTPVAPDQSIQIVSCYSELRELQVLHDRLLDMLKQDDSLQAYDIVVMCPDINQQAALIEAVFGQKPAHRRIPFSISDHNSALNAPLLQAILDWIRLPNSRLAVSELLGWLELPALQRASELDAEALQNIRFWIKSSHIHWAADSEHKQRLGFAASTLNTWQHGINRLLTAYIMNDQVTLFGDQLASEIIPSNADVIALGHLQRLLDNLQYWAQRLSRPMTLAQWHEQISALMRQMIAPDDEEEWQLKPLRDEMAQWREQAAQAGYDQTVDASVIHYLLQNALQREGAHHHYLSGGINFCNLIPMRTLPFKVVCLIGMGDEQFPRNETPLQLDLISRHPQKGDRSSREDDRYMFLQSLLSAQQSFYISYVGRNKKDDSLLEPSVVVSELMDAIEQKTGTRPQIEQTVLQPFSASSFEQGSYASEWLLPDDVIEIEPFNQAIEPAQIEPIIQLRDLITFYKNPQRYFMKHRLNLTLDEADDLHDDDEVFALPPLQRYQINRRLLEEILHHQEIDNAHYLYSGELAEQNLGQIQLAQQTQKVTELLQPLVNHEQYSGLQRRDISLSLSHELQGVIESYSEQGLLQLSLSSLKGKQLIEFWIQHCVLCATESITFSELVHKDRNKIERKALRILTASQARRILQDLIDGFIAGQQQMPAFYPDSAWQYVCSKDKFDAESALQKIAKLWRGNNFVPFYEAQDEYVKTSVKNGVEIFTTQFIELSTRYMQPIIDATDNE